MCDFLGFWAPVQNLPLSMLVLAIIGVALEGIQTYLALLNNRKRP
jgi:hypothetical protein